MRPIPFLAAAALAIGAWPALTQETVTSGSFRAAGGHDAAGAVRILRTADGYQVALGEDFLMDRAPDPHIAFGSPDAFAEGTDFELLTSLSGPRTIDVPAGLDPTEYEAVWLWCRQFGVPLGVAPLD